MSSASIEHEAPIEVLRTEPSAVLDLLRLAGQPLLPPEGARVAVDDAALSEAVPSHRAADLVLLVRDESDRLRLVVVVEVQRAIDDEKRWAWPVYVAQLAARHRAPVALLVLTFEERVRRWASKPMRIGPGSEVLASVLGPRELGVRAAVREGSAEPSPPEMPSAEMPSVEMPSVEMGVLVTLARLAALQRSPRRPSEARRTLEEDVRAGFLEAIQIADVGKRRAYVNLIHGAARAPFRSTLEALMEAYGMGALELIRREGRQEGLQEGLALGEAKALLRVLARRGLAVDPELEARVMATTNLAQLGRWLDCAVTAATLAEVFTEGRRSRARPR